MDDRDFVSIIGPNGGGKTTLLKLILGIYQPDRGSIELYGTSPHRARNRIGYVPQTQRYDPKFPARVMDIVLMGRLDKTRLTGPYRREDKEI